MSTDAADLAHIIGDVLNTISKQLEETNRLLRNIDKKSKTIDFSIARSLEEINKTLKRLEKQGIFVLRGEDL